MIVYVVLDRLGNDAGVAGILGSEIRKRDIAILFSNRVIISARNGKCYEIER